MALVSPVGEHWVRDFGTELAPARKSHPLPQPAAFAAIEVGLDGSSFDGELRLSWSAPGLELAGRYDGRRFSVETAVDGRCRSRRSRRHSAQRGPVAAVALTLTGRQVTVWSREGTDWFARGRTSLPAALVRDEEQLSQLTAGYDWQGASPPPISSILAGGFGQLGLRDLRAVSHADGRPVWLNGELLLSATHAGPGFFDTAHTGIWSLEPTHLTLRHTADIFFRRPYRPGVFGDHATHLVRDGDRWLVATSTWGDFDRADRTARVATTLATTDADLTSGRHTLDTDWLRLPTDGLTSVGVWDPHLVRDGDAWLVGFVTARKFFSFGPAIAEGPSLDRLHLRAADPQREATEGTTVIRTDAGWRVLASDGRDGRRGQRARYPVFDLDLAELGALDAPYPTNLPWPSLVAERTGDGWLLIGFNGEPLGGTLLGYGTHGDVVIMRSE